MNDTVESSVRARAQTAEPAESDIELAQRLRRLDRAAMEQFFERYFEPVFRKASEQRADRREAEALTARVFADVRRALPELDPTQPLDAWVGTIAARRIRASEATRVAREVKHSVPPRKARALLARAVRGLPVATRSTLLLKIYDGLSFRAIASLLRVSPAAVRSDYSTATNELRRLLRESGVVR